MLLPLERLAHAYILEGEAGEQRDLTVRRLVQQIFCQSPGWNGSPCGQCPSCRKVASGTHEDVVTMEQTGKLTYRVPDADAFIGSLSMSSYSGRKVGVIPNADALSEVVQNKLLKTLEEPYPGTVILLAASNRSSLLDTIRSRCISLRMTEEDTAASEFYAITEGNDGTEDTEKAMDESCFYLYRRSIEKNIKSNEDALAYLDQLETREHRKLVSGDGSAGNAIILIEEARRDLLRGMGVKQCLKRLYLQRSE